MVSRRIQTTSKLLQGDTERIYLLNTIDSWAQDDFKVSKKLTVNYGVRYSLPGAVFDKKHDLYSFVPGQGFVAQLYNDYIGGFGPRLGFSYAPRASGSMVIRGAFGMFYDVPGMTNMVERHTGNGGDSYAAEQPRRTRSRLHAWGFERSMAAECGPIHGRNAAAARRHGGSTELSNPLRHELQPERGETIRQDQRWPQ